MVRPAERYLEPALYEVFAIFAFVTAMVTHLGPHRVWGWFAGTAYAIGAVIAIYIRGRSRLVLARGDPEVVRRLLARRRAHSPLERLTEREVLALMAEAADDHRRVLTVVTHLRDASPGT